MTPEGKVTLHKYLMHVLDINANRTASFKLIKENMLLQLLINVLNMLNL